MEPNIAASPESNQTPPQPLAPKKSLPKWPLIIAGIILVATLLTGVYILGKNQSANRKSAQKTTQIPAPTKTTNALNPNTGNLYSDIKVRLNEVLK
jgi:flagellar basal body-associated protein FliL